MRRLLFPLVLLLLGVVAVRAQIPEGNPLVEAARGFGTTGLGVASVAGRAGWPFKPLPGRIYVKAYVAALSNDPSERQALEAGILAIVEGYEKTALTLKQPNDPATALAFSVAVLTSAAKGAPLDDAAFLALIPRLRAGLSKVAATDRQKQQFYEWSLCASGTVLSLMAATTDEGAKEKLKTLADTQLLALIGVKSDAVTLDGANVAVAPLTPAPTMPETSGGIAPGFRFAMPAGWRENGGWRVGEQRDGHNVHAALVRVVPAVPAKGSFSDALRVAWKRYVPEELQNKAGGMVYRRYVGDGLLGQFVFGIGQEKGQAWETFFTVYLIDCGATWQPLVVAQTWRDADTDKPIYSPWTISGSFRHSAPLVEEFLRGVACPAAKSRPLVDRAALAGTFNFGNASALQWENVYTGSTTMTTVSYGGTLDLRPDGRFIETYDSASGVVGALRFRGYKARGTWAVQGDLLTLTDVQYDQGDGFKRKPKRFRIAGVVVFSNGEKVVVLKEKLDEAVNPLNVGDRAEYYSTAKKG